MASADSVRASLPARSTAASSTRQFITVASMPMVSPTGRGTPRAETSTPRKMLPPADHDAKLDAILGVVTRSSASRSTVA